MSVSATLQPFRGRLALFGLNSFVMGLVEASFLVVITRSILSVADSDTTLDVPAFGVVTLGEAAVVAAVLIVLRLVLGLVSVRLQTGLTYRINSSLRRELARDFLAADWTTPLRQQRGMFHQLAVQLPAQVTSLVFQLSSAVGGGLSLFSLLAIAFVVDPLASVVILAALVVLGTVLVPLRRAVRARTKHALEHQAAYTTAVAEVADLGLEIEALGVSAAATAHLDGLVENEMQAHRRIGLVSYAIPTVYTTLAYGAIVLAVLALDAFAGDDMGSLGAVMLIMLRSLTYGQQIQQGGTALSQLGPVVTTLDAHRDELRAARRTPGTRTIDRVSNLSFHGVSFAYDPSVPVLRDATFGITHGEVIGIVGPSGAGKTTLVQLLLGLLTPTSGSVSADGTSLSDIAPESWHRLVTFVPQETRLLDGTLAHNVRFLRDGITDDAVAHALQRANLALDAERFTAGIHTDLGAAGRGFSGGQRQRLAIARALATDPSILVLDEPTSSLDAESEDVIVETIVRLKGSVTTIVVTHRDSTLRACDRVLRVENGSVSVESTR
ncbi:MAG: ABC transporter ATP-binding protein [Actinomycetota bacterium]|nr:ABC transporter ATP-binding protein [Actinomycetota bacterium]